MNNAIKLVVVNAGMIFCCVMAQAGQGDWTLAQAGGAAAGGDSVNSTRSDISDQTSKGHGAITTDPNRNRTDDNVDRAKDSNPRGMIDKSRRRDNLRGRQNDGIRNSSPDRLNDSHPIGTRPEDPTRDGPRPK